MQIEWHVTDDDKRQIRSLIGSQEDTVLVRDRRNRNLADDKETVTRQRLWRAMVCMRLTTQARSGPIGKLATFQTQKPFPLAYDTLKGRPDLAGHIHKSLLEHGVGRHPVVIAEQLAANFNWLEQGAWEEVLERCNILTRLQTRNSEAEVADYLDHSLKGFGPKQARNVLQAMGLTRYEIPIDSRVTQWLNDELSFPFEVTAAPLGDRGYYSLVLDAVCQLCDAVGEFPCILDAAIFGSKDGDNWSFEQLRY